jgi:hypothetical protein
MTTTPAIPADPAVAGRGVVLDCDEAADLARLLEVVEDWLLHADDDARADLAGFLDGSGHGHLAAAGLATLLGHNATTLHRRLRKATTR